MLKVLQILVYRTQLSASIYNSINKHLVTTVTDDVAWNSVTNAKLLLLVTMKAYGGVDLLFYSLLTLALHRVVWQTSRYGFEERVPGVP
jgi:hypothetical protein